MTLEEALDACKEQHKTVGSRHGDKEARIDFLPDQNCYSLREGRPRWVIGQAIEYWRIIGACLSREEVLARIGEVSFASSMSPNGWVIEPEKV